MLRILSIVALLLAGCAPIPPTPQDLQARQFNAVPGKSVIYVVRTPMDSRETGSLAIDDREQITTLGGTYYRWEVAPGTHRIVGVGPSNASITLSTTAGGVYFLEHTVIGTLRSGPQLQSLRQVSDQQGRTLVLRSVLL